MQPIPYVFFKDKCRDAVTRYAEIFGSSPEIMSFKDMPEEDRNQMPGVPDDAVMHASVAIGDGMLFASDDPSGETPEMAGCNVCLSLPDEAETKRVFNALADGGDVRMPLSPMFWTPLFGTLTDKFGVRWMIMADSDYE
ncbi:VOC family protein [Aliiroseovarius sp. S1339]|uniref:VOC family protein n=1 Tax=Aliiroseovarius sp. S1339 TaxID=2936990 RepID=UPI0020C12DAA|nr:VOC family protein [Aliiroseovarius sp. S1339]MCK8462978.1 VOC family protein [Aliiroseovarius sp. S1339]